MEEAMFTQQEDNQTIEMQQIQTPMMDAEDTLILMDSNNSNTILQEHHQLQEVTDLLAEVETKVNFLPTTINRCINNSSTTVSMDGETSQEQIQDQVLQEHNRLLQTPPASVNPHLPQT